ncbi:hypothetical protein GCM10011415_20930 [Salipiger pallidus]|uniref:Uncharacterized protein n=1 Tax=Salipiger pallidus TaxID=1775170 RepID=A0A8J2ZJV8_9RHOB|nr:hypothetical protein [Salipiger pallidus]GGG72648.1 hypothetical protein GCM10011415_20930 [Salipiger pallidus]
MPVDNDQDAQLFAQGELVVEKVHRPHIVGSNGLLLSISWLSFYCAPLGETEMNLALVQVIDRQFPETPFYCVQQMTCHIQNEGHAAHGRQPPAVVYFNPPAEPENGLNYLGSCPRHGE